MNTFLNRRNFVKFAAGGAALSMLPPVWAETGNYDVIVIGAGLSGLHTSYLLEQQGLNVLLLESSERVGGRLYTLDHLEGTPDAGALQVGTNYYQLRAIAERLGISLYAGAGIPATGTLSMRGELLNTQDWGASPANILPESERSMPPSFLIWKYLSETKALTDPGDFLNDEYRYLDIPLDVHLKNLGASDEALRIMNNNFESNNLNEVSALHTLRKFTVIIQSGGAELITNGSSRLPEAMSASLKNGPILNKRVSEIKQHNRGIRVSCTDNSSYTAARCVVATPFSTVRNMDLQVGISDLKRQAINNLGYSHITQVYLRPKSNFWEEDGFTPDLWSDSPIGMLTTESSPEKKVALIRAWLIGDNAKAVDHLPKAEIGAYVTQKLAELRPSTQGQMEVAEVVNWGTNPNSLGAYAHFRPGDVGRFAKVIAQPEAGLHFVGEHTEYKKSGMEAAVLSAERCAQELMATI